MNPQGSQEERESVLKSTLQSAEHVCLLAPEAEDKRARPAAALAEQPKAEPYPPAASISPPSERKNVS